MFKFLPKKAAVFRAVDTVFVVRKASLLKKISLVLFLLNSTLWIIFTVNPSFRVVDVSTVIGFEILFFSLFVFFTYLDLFFRTVVARPKKPMSISEANSKIEEVNFADYFNYEAAELLKKTITRGGDSTTLLYYLLKDADFSHFVFTRFLIDKNNLVGVLKSVKGKKGKGLSDCLKETITISLAIADRRNHKEIRSEDLLVALTESNKYLKKVLIKKDIQKREIESITDWWIRMKKRRIKRKKFWKYENLIKMGSIGRQWASGSAFHLEKFAIDWTEALSRKGFREVVGHQERVKSLERALSGDDKNSVMLVGKPGTGRRAVVNELTRRSFLGLSIPGVNYKRVYKLDLKSLVAKVEGKEKTEKMLDKIFKEAVNAGNIILVIENIQEFISGAEKAGIVDISGVLDSYLNYHDFKVVGVTNYRDYRRVVERNQVVNSHFKKIELEEPSEKESLMLCEMITPGLEEKYNLFISYPALKAAVELSGKFLASESFPEKAMNLLEEAVISASQDKKDILTKELVAEVLSEKAEVPVGAAAGEEKKALLNLEEEVHKRIINQETAVTQIAKSLRRSRTNIDTRTGLIGSFLFLGPTGVGKTETAKAIADIYFGSEEKMIRIDMSEYQSVSDISRLIGSEDGEGILTEQVIEDPFSLILLDELEKAHRDVLNIFLQILDEGHVTDGVGRKVDFKNCMVIATSNAGYQIIMESVKKGIDLDGVREKILDQLFKRGTFRPEFINRFDGTVIFEPLTKNHLMQIAGLQLEDLKENLKEKHIDLKITQELKEKIVEISYEPVFGAREMQRVIQNEVGDELASKILSDDLKAGDKVKIIPEDFSIEKIN